MKKKIYPRISTPIPAQIASIQGTRIKAIAQNISQTGFTIQCSTYQRNALTPDGCFIHNGRPVELDALLFLPFPDTDTEISVRCHIAFSRRVANDKCEIGVRFEEFIGDAYKHLIEFFEMHCLQLEPSVDANKRPSVNPVFLTV